MNLFPRGIVISYECMHIHLTENIYMDKNGFIRRDDIQFDILKNVG